MIISKLKVVNFRNLLSQEIEFGSGLNVLHGKNAQGKTNTLEAIYTATIGRSPRTRKDSEMLAFNKHELQIELEFLHAKTKRSVKFVLKGNHKSICVDGNNLKKISDVIGNFGSVYFSPEELHLVQGSPAYRRRFLDIINCQLSKKYLSELQHFQKVLNQRNALLKNQQVESQILVWNETLAIYAVAIFKERQKFCKKLQTLARKIHSELSDGKEELVLGYESVLKDSDNLKEDYLKGLEKTFEKDKILGYTSYGLQNDDFSIFLNGVDLRKNGSQGQQRTATLALKLAELEILKEEYGEYPVLLLDDVLSELDEVRRQKLMERIQNIQCLLTCTEFDLDLPAVKFKVENGLVNKEE